MRRSSVAVVALSILSLTGCATSSFDSRTYDGGYRHHEHRYYGASGGASGGVPAGTASASVQGQPSAGSCRTRGNGPDSLPDAHCTPGALNPQVSQATIGQTICVRGWTKTVRPSESVTAPEKRASMSAYGDQGSAGGYEYDHLLPLELGGATNDPRNLWPQPHSGSHAKDKLESRLRRLVCARSLPLATAQDAIARDWVSAVARYGGGS